MDKRLQQAASLFGYKSPRSYSAKGNHLFRGLEVRGMNVLEVGCGAGAWAVWAALHGARRVLGIEPEAHGSERGTEAAFERNLRLLELVQRIEFSKTTLQDLQVDCRYDIVILYDVINHLDEQATSRLHYDGHAYDRYRLQLNKLHSLVEERGVVIVADCSRWNLWPSLRLKSPFCPSIEWQKHQSPRVWTQLFVDVGFALRDLRWTPLYPFGPITSNFLVSYITISHFVLRFCKVSFRRD
jgi:cyclopropane fatty-acyl-phospholipid synthase-like methyltransferase